MCSRFLFFLLFAWACAAQPRAVSDHDMSKMQRAHTHDGFMQGGTAHAVAQGRLRFSRFRFELAVGAVTREPVSLLLGKYQGNFREKQGQGSPEMPEVPVLQSFSAFLVNLKHVSIESSTLLWMDERDNLNCVKQTMHDHVSLRYDMNVIYSSNDCHD